MLGSREVWGIVLGSQDLRAVKMTRSGDGATVVEAEVIPYRSPDGGGEAGEGADRELLARETLQALASRHKIRWDAVAISIPGNVLFTKIITLPPVERKRIPEIVKYESRQQIPFPIDEVVWDYQLVRPDPVAGEDIEVALFAVRREIVQASLGNCLAAGVRASMVQAAPLAFCNYLLYDQPAGEPLVVLDVGEEGTELIILDGDRCWPRSLAVGRHDLVVALQQKFQIDLAKAEDLLVQSVKSKQADRLFEVVRPVLQNLSGQVQRTLGFYKSQHPEVRFSKVCIVGNIFDLPGVEGFFKETLRYEFVRLGAPRRVALDEAVSKPAFAPGAPCLAAPMGLALQGLGLGRIQANLIPLEIVQRSRRAAKRPWIAAAALLMAGAVVCMAIRASRDVAVLRQAVESAEGQVAKVEGDIRGLAEAKKAPVQARAALEALPGLLNDRDTGLPSAAPWEILRQVVQSVPKGAIWLDGLRIEPVQIGTVPDASKRAWAKDKVQGWTLKVTFDGQRVGSGPGKETRDRESVMAEFVSKLEAVKTAGAAGQPLFEKFQMSDWFTSSKEKRENEMDKYFFTIECVVIPQYFQELAKPPAPAAPAGPAKAAEAAK